jgi:hypothetical protein
MRSVMRKKMRWAPLMGGAILMCAALMNSARAAVFLVEIQGTFNSNSGFPGITVPPPLPLALSFYINDAAKSCAPNCVTPLPLLFGGGVIYAYSAQTISGFPTLTIGQEVFQPSSLVVVSGGAIFFNQKISNGVAPLIAFHLVNTNDGTGLFTTPDVVPVVNGGFAPPPLIIVMENSAGTEVLSGQIVVRVIGFAGTPGSTPCHDSSTAALAHKYGSLPQAAVALGYSSVKALQADITLFCGS